MKYISDSLKTPILDGLGGANNATQINYKWKIQSSVRK